MSKRPTIAETNKNLPLDKIYPQHFQASQRASLVTKKFPRLAEQLQHDEEAKAFKQAKDDSNNQLNQTKGEQSVFV